MRTVLTSPGQRPALGDYQAAVSRLEQCSEDPLLKRCRPRLGADGQPGADGGTFGAVYRLDDPRDGDSWALKCFLRDEPHRERRYREIAKSLEGAQGSWAADVRYLERGLWVRGQWWPVVLMEWVPGLRLTDWIDRLLARRKDTAPAELRRLAHRFAGAVYQMHRSVISHGDLQSGNVLVTAGTEVRFVDYDAMTAPGWPAPPRREDGHPDFRLPREGERGPDGATELLHTAAAVGTAGALFTASTSTGIPLQETDALTAMHRDRFPSHVIHASLVMLSHDVSLWEQLHRPGSDHLLLSRRDFRDPVRSRAWRELLRHAAPGVRETATELLGLLDCRVDLQPDLEPRPEVRSGADILGGMARRLPSEPAPPSRRPFLDMNAFEVPGGRSVPFPPTATERADVREPAGRDEPVGVRPPAGRGDPAAVRPPAGRGEPAAAGRRPAPDFVPAPPRPGPVPPVRGAVRPAPSRTAGLVLVGALGVLLLALLIIAVVLLV